MPAKGERLGSAESTQSNSYPLDLDFSLFFQQIDADKLSLITVFPEFIPLTSFLKTTSSLSWHISLSCMFYNFFIIVVQLVSPVLRFVTPWTAASQASLPNRHLLEFAQAIHWVSDAIQSSQPLSPPSPPVLNLSQHQGLYQWVGGTSRQVAKVLELQLHHQSFQWVFRVDFL